MCKLIEDIIALEWNEFQKVNNEGCRAACQDNWTNFQLYRRSNLLAWSQEMLKSYHQDLVHAINSGRNLLTEKYARMMESTAPESYREIVNKLIPITEGKKKIIEDISQISVKWAEEFSQEYPMLSRNGRPIHSYEDGPFDTSFETYMRGEISTYSENTLKLYYMYLLQLLVENKNLTKMVMENTVREYGYNSLDQAERRIAAK